MNLNLKRFLAGTFLGISTFAPVFDIENANAWQDGQQTSSEVSTLQALLDSSMRVKQFRNTGMILPIPAAHTQGTDTQASYILPVTFLESDHGPIGDTKPGTQHPLVPRIPAPPRYRPTPLLPSIAAGDTFTVPVVSGSQALMPYSPTAETSTVIVEPSFAGLVQAVPVSGMVPVVSAPIVTGPIVTGPDSVDSAVVERSQVSPLVTGPIFSQKDMSSAKAEVEIQTGKTQPVPIVKGAGAGSIAATMKQTQTVIQSEIATPSAASVETAKLQRPIGSADASSDQIQVDEVSTDDLIAMMMGNQQSTTTQSSSTDSNPQFESTMTTNQSIGMIGSGTSSGLKVPTINVSSPQDIFSGVSNSYLQSQPEFDSGLNQDFQRPTMPSRLPYDGLGSVSGATGYIFLDFLYMDRDQGDFSASLLPANDAYDYTPGARLVFGRKLDSIEGWEASFTLLDAHSANTQIASATNSLTPRLFPTDGFNLASISSFNGASFHESVQRSHYYSAEFSKMNWNWDVMSTFIGIRYTAIDDFYGLNSIGSGGDFGTYRLRARNHLIGPQIGGELFYDIGRRISFSVSGKVGGYLNFYQTNTEFANNNLRIIDNSADDVDLSWGTEMGVFAHYMISPRAKLKAGYEFWYFDNVASAAGQYNGQITPFSGLTSSNSDDALYHGLSFGLEWYR